MEKVRNRFLMFAMIAVSVLLTVLIVAINVMNFTMVAEDADMITKTISGSGGAFKNEAEPSSQSSGQPPMGPSSPDTPKSVRYFTVAIYQDGSAKIIAMNLSAINEDEAVRLGKELALNGNDTGWTNTIYRYRTYEKGSKTFVTVVDQARELLPVQRTLIISITGEVCGLIITFIFLLFISKKLFNPLEEADRKQKMFIKEAENEFKIPLTVINANTEIIEKENGATESTKSIRRQVKKMIDLTKKLTSLSLFEDKDSIRRSDISEIILSSCEAAKDKLTISGINLTHSVERGIKLDCEPGEMLKLINELIDNISKFALTKAYIELKEDDGHIKLKSVNDSSLTEENVDDVFDRFVKLSNAGDKAGNGLGLSYVKDVVKAHNGRISAQNSGGEFTVKIVF